MPVEPEEKEISTIADLEIYGLRPRTATILGNAALLFIADLEQVTESQLREIQNISQTTIREIRTALLRYVQGQRVKTVRECVEFRHARAKRN